MTASSHNISYAQAAQTFVFPQKDQAIIIDTHDETQLKDYVSALGKIVSPTDIKFASRIANNRICVYLSSKQLAESLLDKHEILHVRGRSATIRPLISRNKRIVLSNVCPVIPHREIEAKLIEMGIKPASTITFIRAGLIEPGFGHILSFRRQLYLTPEDEDKLPGIFDVTFDNTRYTICTATDVLYCFACKQRGHRANKCHAQPPSDDSGTNVSREVLDTFPSKHTTNGAHRSTLLGASIATTEITNQGLEAKSNAELVRDSKESVDEINDGFTSVKSKLKVKKQQKDNHEPIVNVWSPIQEIMKDRTYPLNLEQLKSFYDKVQGKHDIKDIVSEYTSNIPELIGMLNSLYPLMTNAKLRARTNGIRKKLELIQNLIDDQKKRTKAIKSNRGSAEKDN